MIEAKRTLSARLSTLIVLVACCAAIFLAWRTIEQSDPTGRSIRELKYRDAPGRLAAAEQLRQTGPEAIPRAVPALAEAVHDTDPRVRLEAIRTFDYLIRRWVVAFHLPPNVVAASTVPVGQVVPALTAALRDPDPAVRAAAIEGLGLLRTEGRSAVPRLLEALDDPVVANRARVLDALGELARGSDQALEAALRAARAAEPEVRLAAIGAVGKIGPRNRRARAALLAALDETEGPIRRTAARALTEFFDDPATEIEVFRLLAEDDTDPELRRLAVNAAWNANPNAELARAVRPYLLRRQELDAATRDAGEGWPLGLLARMARGTDEAPQVLPILIEGLNRPLRSARMGAASGLGELGPDAAPAAPALAQALSDPEPYVRMAAAVALGHIGPPAAVAVPALLASQEDPDPFVRHYAAGALDQIERTQRKPDATP